MHYHKRLPKGVDNWVYESVSTQFDCWCDECVIKHVQKDDFFNKPCWMDLPDRAELLHVPVFISQEQAWKNAQELIAQEEAETKNRAKKAKRNKAVKARKRRRKAFLVETEQPEPTEKPAEEPAEEPTLIPRLIQEPIRELAADHLDEDNSQRVLRRLLTCPASNRLLTDPVIAADSHTYDRNFLKEWFAAGHTASPITHSQMCHTQMFSNYTIKQLAQDYLSDPSVLQLST